MADQMKKVSWDELPKEIRPRKREFLPDPIFMSLRQMLLQQKILEILKLGPCRRTEIVKLLNTSTPSSTVFDNIVILRDRKLVKEFRRKENSLRGASFKYWRLVPDLDLIVSKFFHEIHLDKLEFQDLKEYFTKQLKKNPLKPRHYKFVIQMIVTQKELKDYYIDLKEMGLESFPGPTKPMEGLKTC